MKTRGESGNGGGPRPGLTGDAARQAWRFLRLLADRFDRHGGASSAAALTYTTLLSLVPLMTVALAIFSAFPAADRVTGMVQDFVFAHFVPSSVAALQEHLQGFATKAARLSGAGFAVLIVVALMLMRTIDVALNAIWEVRERRSPLNQFVVYWAILSLGPLFVAASLLATSYLVSLPFVSEVTGGLGERLLRVAPLLASTLGFSLVYLLVPNRRVPLRHALAGGVLAAVLFEIAKSGFAWYLTAFPTYEAIYGALAAIPIFLVWLYLSWLVVLLGAEFTHVLGIFERDAPAAPREQLELADAVRVLRLLWQAQQRGSAIALRDLAAAGPWPEYRLEDLLRDLQAMHLVLRTSAGRWALARDLRQVELRELVRSPRFGLPVPGRPGKPDDARLAELLAAADERLSEVLRVPVAELMPASGPDLRSGA
ncbi:MAG: virulence factor BrkB family protein [Gammaproteobacteria bacterium]